MKTKRKRRVADGGFTLIELMLVIVIIGILAAVVLPTFKGRTRKAKEARAQAEISSFETALDLYEVDNGDYPTEEQGLDALWMEPTAPPQPDNWRPYLKKDIPNDPWGNPYVYKYPGAYNPNGYDVLSAGPDRQPDTEDDIGNWTKTDVGR